MRKFFLIFGKILGKLRKNIRKMFNDNSTSVMSCSGSTFWNKTPKSQLSINRISSFFFFAPHLLASLKAIECSTGPFVGPILEFKLRVSNVGSPACDNNVWVIKEWLTIILHGFKFASRCSFWAECYKNYRLNRKLLHIKVVQN